MYFGTTPKIGRCCKNLILGILTKAVFHNFKELQSSKFLILNSCNKTMFCLTRFVKKVGLKSTYILLIYILAGTTSALGSSGAGLELFFSTTQVMVESSISSTEVSLRNAGSKRDKQDEILAFLDTNYAEIQKESALGRGEHLNTLYSIADYKNEMQPEMFSELMQDNFEHLFKKKKDVKELYKKINQLVNE